MLRLQLNNFSINRFPPPLQISTGIMDGWGPEQETLGHSSLPQDGGLPAPFVFSPHYHNQQQSSQHPNHHHHHSYENDFNATHTLEDGRHNATAALFTLASSLLFQSPVSTLYQQATRNLVTGAKRTSSTAFSSFFRSALAPDPKRMLSQFRELQRRESAIFILRSGLLDLLDGALSGTLLGISLGIFFFFNSFCILKHHTGDLFNPLNPLCSVD